MWFMAIPCHRGFAMGLVKDAAVVVFDQGLAARTADRSSCRQWNEAPELSGFRIPFEVIGDLDGGRRGSRGTSACFPLTAPLDACFLPGRWRPVWSKDALDGWPEYSRARRRAVAGQAAG